MTKKRIKYKNECHKFWNKKNKKINAIDSWIKELKVNIDAHLSKIKNIENSNNSNKKKINDMEKKDKFKDYTYFEGIETDNFFDHNWKEIYWFFSD